MKIIFVLFSVFLIVRGQSQQQIIQARCAALLTPADTFIRNNSNCRGYHVCRNRAYLASDFCGDGLYFDGNRQRCDFAQNVECAQCPDNTPPGQRVPVFGACNKYAVCTAEEIFIQTCGNGLIWNNQCVAPPNPPLAPGVPAQLPCEACPNFYNAPFVMVPDIANCKRYIMCFPIPANGIRMNPIILQCDVNEIFDATSGACLNAPGATCDSPGVPGLPETCPPGPGLVNIPDPEECEYYFTCINGARLPDRYRCAPDFRFDPANRACVPKSLLPCDEVTTVLPGTTEPVTIEPVQCPPEPDIVKLPDPEACEYYYTCSDEILLPDTTRCDDDFRFDPDEATCVPKADMPCD